MKADKLTQVMSHESVLVDAEDYKNSGVVKLEMSPHLVACSSSLLEETLATTSKTHPNL